VGESKTSERWEVPVADGQQAGGNGSSLDPSALAQVVAPLTAVVAVFTSLAVTGVLGQAQRNEGTWIVVALGLVTGGAVAWLVGVLIPPPETDAQKLTGVQKWIRHPDHKLGAVLWWLRRRGGALLKMLAVIAVGAGIVVGVAGLVKTQQAVERPAVSASFDKSSSTLNATVSDQGLGSSQRVVVLVQGLREKQGPKRIKLVADPHTLYYAMVGPDENGKINHSVSVVVPAKFGLVGVKAWSGQSDRGCDISELKKTGKPITPSGQDDGCLALRLPR
jgi:hypothetical protein